MSFQSPRQYSKLEVLHLRFSGPENLHQNIELQIKTLLESGANNFKGSTGEFEEVIASTELYEKRNILRDVASYALPSLSTPPPMTGGDPAATTMAANFMSFANWAFGPNGLPMLKLLALGDFSHGDRYPAQQVLLRGVDRIGDCSRGGHLQEGFNFHPIDISDTWAWDDVSIDGPSFLSACPSTGLMESPYEF